MQPPWKLVFRGKTVCEHIVSSRACINSLRSAGPPLNLQLQNPHRTEDVMPDRARKKELKRLKRQEKVRQHHKAQNIPPVRRVAMSGSMLECWINSNWREQGMASLFLLGNAGAGGFVFAAFLLDIWCVGLKDAYGQTGISRLDFQDNILKRAKDTMPMVRVDPTNARKLVASAIRFSRQNGFKLPAHFDRWTAIFGDLGGISSADLSAFGKDGKLFYMGSREFLAQRLIGMTPEQFMQRPDVQWTMPLSSPDQFGEYDEDDDDFDEELDQPPPEFHQKIRETVSRGLATMQRWSQESGQDLHPRLEDGMTIFVTGLLATGASTSVEGMTEKFTSFAKAALSLPDVNEPAEVAAALKQIMAAFRQMPGELPALFAEGEELTVEQGVTSSTAADPAHPAVHLPQD